MRRKHHKKESCCNDHIQKKSFGTPFGKTGKKTMKSVFANPKYPLKKNYQMRRPD
tara:strand:+ start:525 stop:689 length:165 start_codon:yes stop_codon:yes gene_type:complete